MKPSIVFIILIVLCLLAIALTPAIGQTKINLSNAILDPSSPEGRILFQIRLPRVLLAFLVGASLAISGVVFQVLFRNSLATPYTLGTSSGASLSVVIAMHLGLGIKFLGLPFVVPAAMTGGLAFLLILYALMRGLRRFSPQNVLLAGVTLGYLASAAILFVYYISSYGETQQMIYWTMGSLDTLGFTSAYILLPFIILIYPYIQYKAGALNLLSIGEDFAATRAVDIKSTQRWLLILTTILISACVSVSGPIGFIGLVIPHAMRLILGTDNRRLIPASLLGGGLLLCLCDTLARSLFPPADLPVGILTATLGGPFFLYLLIRSLKNG